MSRFGTRLKPGFKSAFRLATALSVAVLLAGCETVQEYSLTCRLWENPELKKWSEAAPDPHLSLFATPDRGDILVLYDAFSESHTRVERRAYYAGANEARVAAGKSPHFVRTEDSHGLSPIPLFNSRQDAPGESSRTYAVTSKEGRAFTVIQPNQAPLEHELPVFPETSGTFLRVLGTPLAVAGDTLLVGAVAATLGALIWLSGGPGICYH